MTAQWPDTIELNGREYSIATTCGRGLFLPNALGISYKATSTACHRGYRCWYAVADGHLELRRLTIGLSGGDVKLGRIKIFEKIPKLVVPRGKDPDEMRFGIGYADHEVAELTVRIAFNGGILAGRDFIPELYVHTGVHPPYKYKEVKELIFNDGTMVSVIDRSEDAAKLRETIPPSESSDLISRLRRFASKDLEFTGLV